MRILQEVGWEWRELDLWEPVISCDGGEMSRLEKFEKRWRRTVVGPYAVEVLIQRRFHTT